MATDSPHRHEAIRATSAPDWLVVYCDMQEMFAEHKALAIEDRWHEGTLARREMIDQAKMRHETSDMWLLAARWIHDEYGTEYRDIELDERNQRVFDVTAGSDLDMDSFQFYVTNAMEMLIQHFNPGLETKHEQHRDDGQHRTFIHAVNTGDE